MKTTALLSVALLASAVAVPFVAAADQPVPAASTVPAAALPPVNHLVYLARLPTPAALMKEAAEQGKSVERIDRTADSLVVVYKYADGHTDTYGYTTLSAASTEEEPVVAPVATTPAPTTTVVTTRPTTTVIYQDAPPVYYYETRYRYYRDPFDDFWAPLTLGIGIGWISGGHGCHYYHGYGGWRH